MSASSTSDTKKRDSSRSTSKKSKKKAEQERTAGNSGLHSISEGTKEFGGDDSDGNPSARDENDVSGDEGSQDPEVTMSDMMRYMHEIHESLTDNISYISKRVDDLEVTRNLSGTGAFSTPKPKRKKEKHKKERRTSMSLMDSVVRSSAKMNWRTIQKDNEELAEDEQENYKPGSNPDDPDPGSSDDDDGDSSNSKSDSSDDDDNADNVLNNSSTKGKFKSPLGHLFRSLDASQKSASRTVVNVTRVEKECSVRITDFALNNVCRAMKSIIEFQERENTEVKMTKVLSTSCKKHLRIKYNVLSGDLIDMNMSTLFSIIAKETRVHSRVQFYSELKKALSHTHLMEWDKVNSNNHEVFYFQQLNLAEDFMLVLRIMLQENKHECPKVNDKENGLIRLFRSFHSYDYWKYIWCGMKQHYSKMQDFIDEYLDKAMQQYQLSQALKEIPYKQSTKAADKEKAYYDRKRDITKSFNRSNNANSKFVNNHNHLHNIDGNSSSDDNSVDDTWHNANPVVSDKQTTHEQYGKDEGSDEDSISVASNETKEDNEQESPTLDLNLAAFSDHSKPNKLDKKELACLRKLLSGKCDNIDCPFGHRRDVLVKGATDMKGKLSAFLSAQGTSNSETNKAPYKILTKDKYSKA